MGQNLVVGCHYTADVKACMLKVECLKYAEEACYGGTLIIQAFSSGLEIGSCNWGISGPKASISYISSSVFSSAAAMSFNYQALQRSDVILYSDFSSCNGLDKFDNDDNCSGAAGNNYSNLSSDDVNSEGHDTLLNDEEYLEEMEKLNFICSCSVDCIKAGGSVLIPIARIGITLQLLERFAVNLASENMRKSLLHLQISFQNGCASSGKIVSTLVNHYFLMWRC